MITYDFGCYRIRHIRGQRMMRAIQVVLVVGAIVIAADGTSNRSAQADTIPASEGLLGKDVDPIEANKVDAILAGGATGCKTKAAKSNPEKPDARVTKVILPLRSKSGSPATRKGQLYVLTGVESKVVLSKAGAGKVEFVASDDCEKFRYTTDGSSPSVNSSIADSSIKVGPGSVIKYIACNSSNECGSQVGVIMIGGDKSRMTGMDTAGYLIATIAGPVLVRTRKGTKGAITELLLRGETVWAEDGLDGIYVDSARYYSSVKGLQLWAFSDFQYGNACSSWGTRLVAFSDAGLSHMSFIPQCGGPDPIIQSNPVADQLEVRIPAEKARRGSEQRGSEVLYSFDGFKVQLLNGKRALLHEVIQSENINPGSSNNTPNPQPHAVNAGGDTRSTGSILSVIRSNIGGVNYIYEKYLRDNPKVGGKLTLKFTIAPSGDVIAVSVDNSTTGNSQMDAEIADTARRMKFDPADGGNSVVGYTYELFRR